MVIWAVCLRLNSDTFEFIFVVIVLQKACFFCLFFLNLMGRGSAPHSLYMYIYIFKIHDNVCKFVDNGDFCIFVS